MAELATLARPYANAAFDIAKGDGALDQWARMLSLLAAAAGMEAVRELIASPAVASVVKADRLVQALGDELNVGANRFVHVLAENKRLELLREISAQFDVLKADAERTLDVEIESAVELSDAELDAFTDSLTKRYSQDISVTTRVDESLVAGAVIRAGDTVIDGSIRGKLAKLAETLARR